MSLRELIVPVRGDGQGESVLNHAIALAQRFGAHIDVVHCRPNPSDMLSFDIRIPHGLRDQITQSASGAADADERYLRELFDRYCQSHDLVLCDERPWPRDRTTARWREETGIMPEVLGKLGRVYDLSVLARPDPKKKLGYRTLKAAMVETGRPALLCPPSITVESVGLRPVIAWNGSAETVRTITAAQPLLQTVGEVTVLTVETGEPLSGPSPEALADHLRAHGLNVDVQRIEASARQVPEKLLEAAVNRNADCMIAGAFGHSRKLEFIMGSVTQHLIERAELPLFMMH